MSTEKQAMAALNTHSDRLTALPNVVGVGISNLSDKQGVEDLGVVVYVSIKVPQTKLTAASCIPKKLDAELEGGRIEVLTQVVEVGSISVDL